ncbi:acetylornithine deacetylase [Enhydrobacter aerosaccus]|uniref:Acetylornithine deacetylase n=1 Tax=Enhydrobacter aerosaccus TaxID=225324 RepID=A0A1T4SX14_9HYPH|nr:acetylornithine deacetylase [Enhydrobacter aerosaccus]SKA32461.1 acetylornithine deacetylase [Enhydrobacter aerosaccus]
MAGETVDSVEMLRRLVAFDTTSRNSNLALIEYVQGYLKGHGVDSKLVPNEDGSKANLFATVGPKVAGGVVLSGHTDVVPVDGQPWVTDPWTLTLKDGKYHGRGTCDMKAFSAIGLAMLPEFLKAKLKKPVHFALSYDEEVGCFGAHSLAARMAAEVPKPRAVIIGEPTMMTVVHAHKGTQIYITKFTGFEAHSSMTHLGVSAIHFAAEFVHYLNQVQEELEAAAPKNSEFMPAAATFNVGTIVGGTAGNILARECEVLWGYRELPTQPIEELGERAQKWLKEYLLPKMKAKHPAATIETVLRSSTPAFSAEGNDEAKALAARWSGSNTAGSVVYATEAGIFRKTLGVPTVVCGPGDIAQAHQPNEFILASQIEACEGFMRRMIEWASQD